MLESFGRGLKMIGASVKMGWQDKRLLLPSVVTVFTNIFFGFFLLWLATEKMHSNQVAPPTRPHPAHHSYTSMFSHGHGFGHRGGPAPDVNQIAGQMAGQMGQMGQMAGQVVGQIGVNAPMDPSGMGSFQGLLNTDAWLSVVAIMSIWWLTNRFLEGVTTALVYSHLTEGRGTGTFREACAAVASSFPAIVALGLVTLLAKTVASWLRKQKDQAGVMSMGFKFLAGIVEVFWTLAGHLILPAIVIEGTSFWGGMKRADKIAQSNLLTIGVGEVGVDGICRFTSYLVYSAGMGIFGYMYYMKLAMTHPLFVAGTVLWVASVVVVTALSIYIRAAFYTCLYVWAIEAESVRETERKQIPAPGPLAAALA